LADRQRSDRAKDLFELALRKSAEERDSFLSEQCGADAELRAEIDALFESSDAAVGPPPFRLKAGTRLGPYEIVDFIDASGMGEVYKARDLRLNRIVALKTLLTHHRDDVERRLRFEREAQAIAALKHPHICVLHDVGRHDGIDFLVMEFLEGETLARRLERGALPIEQVQRYGIEVADALDNAHRHGVIHRDLKPGNIMLTEGGVKLLDFGLAKLHPMAAAVGTGPTVRGFRTEEGAIFGTLPYMSPEQLEGKPTDERSDIFAFGAVLYEMASGRRAFNSKSRAGLIASILERDPEPLAAIRPEVPSALERLVRKCLAKSPEARWQSASDLADELRWIAGPAESGRHRTLRWVAIGLSLLLAAGVVTVWRWQDSDRRAAQDAQAAAFRERDWVLITDFQNQTGEPLFDYTLRATLETALQQSRYVNVVPRDRVFDGLRRMRRTDLFRLDEATALELSRREDFKVVLAGMALSAGGTFRVSIRAVETTRGDLLFAETQQFRRLEELFDRFDAVARAVREKLGESVAQIANQTQPLARVTTQSLEALQLYSRAVDAASRGKYEEARDLLEAALTHDSEFAMAHVRLGHAFTNLGQFEKRREHYARAYALRDRVTQREAHMIASTYFDSRYEYDKAIASWRVHTTLYPDDVTARYQLALALYETGALKAAVSELRAVLALNPFHSQSHATLVLTLAQANEPVEASAAYAEAAARGIETPYLQWGLGLARLSQDQTDSARATFSRLASAGGFYEGFGDLYLSQVDSYQGKLAAAITRLEAGFALDRRSGNLANELLRHYLVARAALLQQDKRLAERHVRTIVSHTEQQLIPQNLYQAGTLFVRLGNAAAARGVARRLAKVVTRTPSPFHQALLGTLEGEIALLDGRVADAAPAFESAIGRFPMYEAQEGLARLRERRGEWPEARQGWQRVIESRGDILQVGFAADWPLAHVQLARACRNEGNIDCARGQYETFLKLWRQGDDLTIRREADVELRQLARAVQHARD
jgi:tetratricopeptide (TPR) repeat protein/tRNA A-37 threonylcarbamoyl transferase component Bud32